MKATGNKPPMMVASKGLYMTQDLERNAVYYGVPLKLIEVCTEYVEISISYKYGVELHKLM